MVCRVRDGLRGREDGKGLRGRKPRTDRAEGWFLRGRKPWTESEGRFAGTQTLDRINVITTPCRCGIQGL